MAIRFGNSGTLVGCFKTESDFFGEPKSPIFAFGAVISDHFSSTKNKLSVLSNTFERAASFDCLPVWFVFFWAFFFFF